MPRLSGVVSALIALTCVGVAEAQVIEASPSINKGELVRVWAESPSLDGILATFNRFSSDSVVITGQMNANYPVRANAIRRLEVQRSYRPSFKRTMVGVLIGAAGGALIGAPMGRVIECGGACDKVGRTTPMVGRALGASIGAGVGGIIGGVIAGHKRQRWHEVSLVVR